MPLFLLMLFLFMNTMLSKISEEKQRSPFTEFALDEDGKKTKKTKRKPTFPCINFHSQHPHCHSTFCGKGEEENKGAESGSIAKA